jgi:putative PIN family toxin of toxin-antitoxin system
MSLRVVIDTNVVLEGLTQRGGVSGLIIDAWLAGLLEVCISDTLVYEYADVLSRKLSEARWERIRWVLNLLLDRSQFIVIYYSWRPTSPDPGDDHIIDCAMNASAIVVTSNIRDFRSAQKSLGLVVLTPQELFNQLISM